MHGILPLLQPYHLHSFLLILAHLAQVQSTFSDMSINLEGTHEVAQQMSDLHKKGTYSLLFYSLDRVYFFMTVVSSGGADLSSAFFSALFSLVLFNFRQQDLCYFAWCNWRVGVIPCPSSSLSISKGIGNCFRSWNLVMFLVRDKYPATLSVHIESAGQYRLSDVICWHWIHFIQSVGWMSLHWQMSFWRFWQFLSVMFLP